MYERTLEVQNIGQMAEVFGSFDENIKLVEKAYGVTILNRQTNLKITGNAEEEVKKACRAIEKLVLLSEKGEPITEQSVRYIISMVEDGTESQVESLGADVVVITAKGKPVKAKTIGQKKYIEAIRKNTLVFVIGPAGTGKTYLAVAAAVNAFRKNEVSRIILTRPAVEAGEKLGFLPGDLQNKVDPYLRPLYDALMDMLGTENFQKYVERGTIEVAPLAYMRGRTLEDSFIILDEAQNTTPEQMKMFLTRMGYGSRVVVTGDITQIDLPGGIRSGLKDAVKVLKNIEDIAIENLNEKDVVRHPLVQAIVRAYEKNTATKLQK